MRIDFTSELKLLEDLPTSFVDGGNSSSSAAIFIVFDDWKDRADPSLTQDALLGELNMKFGEI